MNWWIDETFYPGPVEELPPNAFRTQSILHHPIAPTVGTIFYNLSGQALGLVLDFDSTTGIVTLQVDGVIR